MRKYLEIICILALFSTLALAAGIFSSGTTSSGSGDLLSTNNLSDVADAATSATNLGLGTGNMPSFAGLTVNGTISANSLIASTGITLGGVLNTIWPNSGIVTANADTRYVSNNQTTDIVLNGSVDITQGTLTANEVVATGGITLGGVRNTSWPSGGVTPTQSVQFVIPGVWCIPATTNILRDYGRTYFEWNMGSYLLKNFKARVVKGETGASANISLLVNGVGVSTLNMTDSHLGWVTTTNFTSATIVDGDDIEISTDAAGGNDDSADLTVQFNARSN